jgi:hypothetical protein
MNSKKFKQYAFEAQQAGYVFINGLFDSCNNVYHIVAIVKNPDSWEPYDAPRYFDDIDAVALWWWFDDDLTSMNDSGDMIYHEPDPNEYDDPDEMPEVNTSKYEMKSIDSLIESFEDLSPKAQKDVLTRLKDAATGSITERWDAYRLDR